MRGWRNWLYTATVSSFAIGLAACGGGGPVALPSTGASMEGAVKYGDKTLHYGIVIVDGGTTSAQGQINLDGTYMVDNCPVGPVKLAVVTNQGMARGAQMAGGSNQGPDAKGPGKMGKVPDYVDVPTKFHTAATSGLTYNVEKGVNKYEIVIPK